MEDDECDRLRLYAARAVLTERLPAPRVVAEMARAFPAIPGLAICYILTEFAVDAPRHWNLSTPREAAIPAALMQAVAVLSADLFALHEAGHSGATGQDLLDFWGEGDGFFVP